MSDEGAPRRPIGPRLSHLFSEPVPISFISPQQISMLTSGHGSMFDNFRMRNGQQQQQQQPRLRHSTSIQETFDNDDPVAEAAASPTKLLKALPPQTIDLAKFKGFKFVTLDRLQITTRTSYAEVSGAFKWDVCEDQVDHCINLIQNQYADRRVFLISSGSLGSQIVPRIHELPQVYAIYIYCANVKFHREWANKYHKIRTVCDNDTQDLLPIFAVDVAQSNIDWGNALLEQGVRDKAKEKFQLALDKLNVHARNHDPAMVNYIKKKLNESQ